MERKQKINEFVNRWIKAGKVAQDKWPFLAKQELEEMLEDEFQQGRESAFTDVARTKN